LPMSKYSVNIRKFAIGLLPFALRGNVKELLGVLMQPLRSLHNRFTTYRKDCLWRLSYNACVGSMQAMLNDRFYDKLHSAETYSPILIDDGESVPSVLVYPNAAHQPLMIGRVMLTSHTTWGTAPFVVKIPMAFYGDTDLLNAVEALVKQYKLSGTKYTIEYYEEE